MPHSENDQTMLTFVRGLFSGAQFKATIAILYVCVAASVWKTAIFPTEGFWPGTYRIFGAFLLLGVIPAGIVKYIFREKLVDYGLGLGDWPRTVRSTLIMMPLLIFLGYMTGCDKSFLNVYPLNPAIRPGAAVSVFLLHLASYLFYYVGWEFMFRGFLQKATQSQAGPFTAILIQTMASTMLHYGHPASEVFGAILGGLFWGFLAYKTRSLWAGFIQHTILGFTLDTILVYGP